MSKEIIHPVAVGTRTNIGTIRGYKFITYGIGKYRYSIEETDGSYSEEDITEIIKNEVNLVMYAIRNSNGLFFKSVNEINGEWVKDINKAKVYKNTSGPRTMITYFNNAYPNYPLPELIKLTLTRIEVINEEARIKENKIKKERLKLVREERRTKEALERAEKDLLVTQNKLNELKK